MFVLKLIFFHNYSSSLLIIILYNLYKLHSIKYNNKFFYIILYSYTFFYIILLLQNILQMILDKTSLYNLFFIVQFNNRVNNSLP